MAGKIAVRRETKSPLERRTPITPDLVGRLVKGSGVEVLVQPSARRIFPDNEYVRAGATMAENLGDAKVVLGVKEIPPDLFHPNTAYVFFSHVIKGQPYNMPMLAKMLELGCTLIDYEKICDQTGKRLIFFGRFAGRGARVQAWWRTRRRSWCCAAYADCARIFRNRAKDAGRPAPGTGGISGGNDLLPAVEDHLSPGLADQRLR